jgi:hypothetical protein
MADELMGDSCWRSPGDGQRGRQMVLDTYDWAVLAGSLERSGAWRAAGRAPGRWPHA